MLQTIRTYIEKNNLLSEDDKVLVGLSGGADSVALLAILVRLKYKCIALHCNFHLRGEESDRDKAFAEKVAADLGIPFYSTDFDTERYATENHLSIEMAARELRYEWFESKRQELKAQAVVIAHHKDDSVETLLINMLRGAGIRGMGGIRPRNGYIVRPLLPISREDILDWLAREKYSFVTDSTNLSDIYTRNFIRLRVLPLLEKINPAAKNTIARTAEHLSEVETIYLEVIKDAKEKVIQENERLFIPRLLNYPSPQTILYELLKPYGFNRVVAQEIFQSLTKTSGKTFYSSNYRLIKDRDYLLLTPIVKEELPDSFIISSEEDIHHLPIELSFDEIVLTTEILIQKDRQIAYFDKDKITFPLELRRWREGDWFIPFGMNGKKKLSDYFTDHKFSRFQKEEAWLLCSANDILWIIGERTDNRFRVDSTTKQVLIAKKAY